MITLEDLRSPLKNKNYDSEDVENVIINLQSTMNKQMLEETKGNKPDMVNHPQHYISETGLEVIDVIEAFTFDLKGIEATDTGNIIKYICRWKQKNGLEDLKKAQWYINHLIKHVEKMKGETDETEGTV